MNVHVHVLWQWPVLGPWVDFSCIHCPKTWRLPLSAVFDPQKESSSAQADQ